MSQLSSIRQVRLFREKNEFLDDEHITGLRALLKPKPGKSYLKCPGCGKLHEHTGALIDSCHDCGYCRHPSTTSAPHPTNDKSPPIVSCDECGEPNPKFVEMTDAHHQLHDHTGKPLTGKGSRI